MLRNSGLAKSESTGLTGGNVLLLGLRTLILYVWVVLATTVLGIVAICLSLFARNADPVHLIARLWARSILAAGLIPVSVAGLEKITPGAAYVYMSNHQSNFDIPVLLACLPVQFRWLAKAELFRIPIFGRAMRGAGYISIDRSDRPSAFESIDRAARAIRSGVSVMIFPEGTRSRDGRLQPFKKGGFVLAVDSGVPIVPLVIRGTHDIMPKGRRMIRPRPVELIVCAPIATSGYSRESKDLLMAEVHAALAEKCHQCLGDEVPC